MAFLFLKQKLFPTKDSDKMSSGKQSSKPQITKEIPYTNDTSIAAKSLLVHKSDDDATLRGGSTEPDLEAQSSRSYDTFSRRNSNGESTTTITSNNSTRARINPRIISDAILGLSDGLTVPFALSAGLSALGNTKVVVLGGLAELAAGAISMGLGGYVGAKSEA